MSSTARQILLRTTTIVAQILPVRRVFFRYLLDFVGMDLVLTVGDFGVTIDATVALVAFGRRLLG